MSKILVIGESGIDKWLYVDCVRIAPDLPIQIVTPNYESENPGMAANVKRNIEALGQECDLVTNENWKEMTKMRIVHEASNHTFIRIDSNDKVERIPEGKRKDCSWFKDYSLVLVSDYCKGLLTEEDIEWICANHSNVFLDTKKILGKWAEGAKFIKINNYEYEASLPFLTPKLNELIVHTRGDQGANYRGKNYPTEKVEVKDSSGAGDVHISALAVKYLETGDIEESILFANKCATKVIKEKGVTVINL